MLTLPNQRSRKILSILLQKSEPIVIKKLAQEFDVSSRTIREDLNKLSTWLADKEPDLIKKPRIGVWLEITDSERLRLQQKLTKLKKYKDPLSPAKRKQYILKCLLQTETRYTMQDLANELYVSRSTIYKDLQSVEEWLADYNLDLKRRRNYGVEVVGTEKNWRQAVSDLLAELKNDQELKEILEGTVDLEVKSRIDNKNYYQLRELFGAINFRNIEEVLEEAEAKFNFLFTDEAFIGLVVHIAISLERLKENHDIKMKPEQLANLQGQEEFKIAKYIVERLELDLDIKIPTAEVGYISLHVLGSKLQQNIETSEGEEVLANADPQVVEMAQEIISIAEEVLEVNFSQDKQLLLGLVLHLRPAINRLKYGMSLRNPLLERIKEDYFNVFGAAWATSIVFEKQLGIKVNEEEIGYIALHLGGALERVKQGVKAVVVCGSGIGTSQLAATKLTKRLSGLRIVDLVSAHKLNQLELTDVDLIISTIPLNSAPKPLVEISPLVTENDINLIKKQLTYVREKKKRGITNEQDKVIDRIFDLNLVFVDLDFSSKEEVIKFLGGELYKQDKVKDGFAESVLQREELTSTALGNQVAIPHGEAEYIKESVVAIAVLKSEINWASNSKVKVVVLAAVKEQLGKNFFKCFHQLLENKKKLQQLKEAKTSQEIIDIFKGE